MKRVCFVLFICVFLQLLYSESAYSQVSGYDDHFDTEIYSNPDLIVTSDLTITSSDTLIVQNLTLPNKIHLVIESGGVLLIMGNLITFNQMTIKTGGTLIVMGNFSHEGSDKNKGSFTATGGDFSGVYILGKIDEDGDNQDVTNNGSYPVLDCDPPTDPPNDGLTDYIDGCNYGKLPDLIENPVYQAICGQGLSGGAIENGSGVCYETLVFQSLDPADDSFDTYNWFYTEDENNIDLNGKPLSISTWVSIENEHTESCVYDGNVTTTTYFVRQGRKAKGCVIYSNIEMVESSGGVSPNPIGIFFDL